MYVGRPDLIELMEGIIIHLAGVAGITHVKMHLALAEMVESVEPFFRCYEFYKN